MSKRIFALFIILTVIVIGIIVLFGGEREGTTDNQNGTTTATTTQDVPDIEVMRDDLEIPWDIAFLPRGALLVSERTGQLSVILEDGTKNELLNLDVDHTGEAGLLGITLHPDFETNAWVYLYMSGASEDRGTVNRVVRFKLVDDGLIQERTILENIPGAPYHDGGRIEFGPDGYLYIATGDATVEDLAQNRNSLAGKILRLTDEGNVAPGNPFGTPIYSYGHRNPQGIAWDSEGRLWSTEHGRSGVLSGFDEINLIKPGNNYGWPTIQGDETREDMVAPKLQSGPSVTWAPASAAIQGNNLYFGGLRGEALYRALLSGEEVVRLDRFFHEDFGRIRTVRVGPDDMLYITTSNRDGRGDAKEGDDKIIRINPESLD